MDPLVSVIIPVYNVKDYLHEALDSVIGQTYKNIEILIIDDGSTDGSETICDEFALDPRVTVIHQDNGGLSNARNAGLDLAQGEYICFLDPDDAYHPAFIAILVNEAINSHAEMVACRYTEQNSTAKLGVYKRRRVPSRPVLSSGVYSREDALRSLVKGDLDVSVWDKLYKGNLWSSIRFPDGRNSEDIDTIYLVMSACQIVSMIDEALYFKRDQLESIAHDYSAKNVRDMMLACSILEEMILSAQTGLFSDSDVEQYKQHTLNAFMDLFFKCYKDKTLRNEIREKILKRGRAIKQWNIRTMVAYTMVRYMPVLFRWIYVLSPL